MLMSEASCVFIFICCSTWVNWTNCWVNSLVSSGSSGFWFFSWVVSRVRNVSKLFASVVVSDAVLVTPAALLGAVPVAEAMMACVLADHHLRHRGQVGTTPQWPFLAQPSSL